MMVRKSSECECKQQRGKNFKNFVQASYVLIIFSFPKISHNNNNTTTTTTHNISRRLSGFALPTIASITSEEQPFFTTQRSSRTELGRCLGCTRPRRFCSLFFGSLGAPLLVPVEIVCTHGLTAAVACSLFSPTLLRTHLYLK